MTKLDSVGSVAVGAGNAPVKPATAAPVSGAGASSSAAEPTAPTPPVDKVSLTGDAVRLQQLDRSAASLGKDPPVDGKRVASLRSAIASGRYKVDAEAVAAKMSRLEGDLATA